jgi:hypothetical protein
MSPFVSKDCTLCVAFLFVGCTYEQEPEYLSTAKYNDELYLCILTWRKNSSFSNLIGGFYPNWPVRAPDL